jgi:hypothetical protein
VRRVGSRSSSPEVRDCIAFFECCLSALCYLPSMVVVISDAVDVAYSVKCPLNHCLINAAERRRVLQDWGLLPADKESTEHRLHVSSAVGISAGAGAVADVALPSPSVQLQPPRWCGKCSKNFQQSPEVVAGLAQHFPQEPGCNCVSTVCSECWKSTVLPRESSSELFICRVS